MDIDLDSVTFDDIPESELPPEESAPRRTRKPRADKGVPRGARTPGGTRRPRGTTQAKIAQDLLTPIASIAVALSMTHPTAGAVLLQRGENVANAFVEIASKHPKMLKALQAASDIGPMVTVIETGVAVATAFAVDSGNMAPDTPIAAMLGITELHAQVRGDPHKATNGAPPDPSANGSPPPPFAGGPPPMMPGKLPTDPNHPMYSFRAGG